MESALASKSNASNTPVFANAVTISANISENYTLTEAISYLENIMAETAPNNQITWKGKSEEIKETSSELFIIFVLALLTAYLVMAATFNSFNLASKAPTT